jgi:hypothetical protein
MNGLNQQMKKLLPMLNYLIYEHGKYISIIKIKTYPFFFNNRLSDAEFRLSLERYKPRSTAVVDSYEREIRRLRDDIEFAQRRSRARSLSPVYR